MKFTGSSMRNELNFITEAFTELQERFLKATDPTMVIGEALEGIQNQLSAIQQLYKTQAQNREEIKGQVMNHLKAVSDISLEAIAIMNGETSPEDNNTSIPQ